MALIDCPECNTQVSSAAPSCPKCGYPIAQEVRSALGETADEKATGWDGLRELYEEKIDPQTGPGVERDPAPRRPNEDTKWSPERLAGMERDVRSGFPQRTGLSKRNKVMLGVAGVLLLWVIVIALGGGDQRPSALVATSQPAEGSKSTSGFERLCASNPAAFVAEATGIPQDRIEITECDESRLTVYASPRNTSTHAGEHLTKLMPALVHASYMRSGDWQFIHFKVVERGTTVTGAPGRRIVSRASYDFNKDRIDWTGGR